jgi:hypothetical protein
VSSALEKWNPASVITSGVDQVVMSRWDDALRRAAATSGTRQQRVEQLVNSFSKELAALGAVTGASAAAPGIGTVAAITTAAADLGWFTLRAGDLILSIAAVHGHTEPSVEERRAWVLSILAFGNSASKMFTKLAGEAGKGIGARATARIPVEVLQRMNRRVGRTLITKYGSRRGAIALGRALPLGIGAVIGGVGNYGLIRVIGRQADEFFTQHPGFAPAPNVIEITSQS